jgi:predicted dithiol-disulfide oxidoreductase (DUF899 family)
VLDDDMNERGIDLLQPVYNMLDLTPQGRGNWYASLDYGTRVNWVPPRPLVTPSVPRLTILGQ